MRPECLEHSERGVEGSKIGLRAGQEQLMKAWILFQDRWTAIGGF